MDRISQTPDLTLHGLKDELAARGAKVPHNAVWLFLRREGLRRRAGYRFQVAAVGGLSRPAIGRPVPEPFGWIGRQL